MAGFVCLFVCWLVGWFALCGFSSTLVDETEATYQGCTSPALQELGSRQRHTPSAEKKTRAGHDAASHRAGVGPCNEPQELSGHPERRRSETCPRPWAACVCVFFELAPFKRLGSRDTCPHHVVLIYIYIYAHEFLKKRYATLVWAPGLGFGQDSH